MEPQKTTGIDNGSNLRSLRNILNNRRTPLSKYMNKKSKNSTDKNLSYFDKLKCMIGNRQSQNKHLNEAIQTQGPTYKNLNNMEIEEEAEQENLRSKSLKVPNKNKVKQPQTKLLKSRRIIEKQLIEQIKTDLQYRNRAISAHNTLSGIAVKEGKVDFVNYGNFQTLLEGGKMFSKVEMKQVLGSGASASVRLCIFKNVSYAVKIYEKYKLLQPRKKKRVYTEIQLLGNLSPHPNVIELHQAYEDKRQIHMVFEQIQGAVTLHQYFRDNMLNLPEETIKQIFKRVTKGVYHLHCEGVSHRDIKPDNILLGFDEEGVMIVKIIDFGFATSMTKTDLLCGTPNFMAPQLSEKSKKYCPFQVDTWALGVLLFFLCEGRYPFRGFDEKDLFRNIRGGNFQIKRTINEDISTLIEMCLKVDPNQRIPVHEILLSPWFKN